MNEESDDENEGRQSKRRRLNEEDILRRSERRKWVENRATILFNYSQYSYYGKSVCIIIYDFDNDEILFLRTCYTCSLRFITERNSSV